MKFRNWEGSPWKWWWSTRPSR